MAIASHPHFKLLAHKRQLFGASVRCHTGKFYYGLFSATFQHYESFDHPCGEPLIKTQRTGSHILARNICVAAWMIIPVFPIEALTQNPGILIQKLF